MLRIFSLFFVNLMSMQLFFAGTAVYFALFIVFSPEIYYLDIYWATGITYRS